MWKKILRKMLWFIIKCIALFPAYFVACLFVFTGRFHGFLELLDKPKLYVGVCAAATLHTCVSSLVKELRGHRKRHPVKPDVCYSHILESLEKLQAPFQEQIKNLKPQDMLTIPHDHLEVWSDMGHFIKVTYEGQLIDEEVKTILEQITASFIRYSPKGEEHCPDIWTPEAIKHHTFWKEMRTLATKALSLLKPQPDKTSQVFQK